MSRLLVILLILASTLNAAEVSVTMKDRSTANVVADKASIEAELQSTATSGKTNQLTDGNSLRISVYGLPKGTVEKIRMTMHSNISGGSGSMTIDIAGQNVWTISNKAFSQWFTGAKYTNNPISFAKSGSWAINNTDKIELTISATANSLYFDTLTISYAEAPKEIHGVELHYYTSSGPAITMLSETQPEAGILLPNDASIIEDANGNWQLVGWVSENLPTMSIEPDYNLSGSRIYPQEDMIMYGLYTTAEQVQQVEQDTNYLSGEYAIISKFQDQHYMAKGGVGNDGYVSVKPFNISRNGNGLYQADLSILSTEYRYNIVRTTDSVQIQNVATKTYIGYNKTVSQNKLASKASRWGIRKQDDKSVVLHHDYKSNNDSERTLRMDVDVDEETGETIMRLVDYSPVYRLTNYEGLVLLKLDNVATHSPQSRWTCRLNIVDAIDDNRIAPKQQSRKMLQDGQIRIVNNNGIYGLNGERICK